MVGRYLHYYVMLLNSMGSIYTTHALIESLNLSIVVYILALAYQSACTPSKVLYSLNLYVEMVWLLVPTGVVVAMMARVVIIQAAEEDVCHLCYYIPNASMLSTHSICMWCSCASLEEPTLSTYYYTTDVSLT